MKNKASLVLIEQAIMILVFALAAALCLQAFAWSEKSTRQTAEKDKAAVCAQNTAELVRHHCGDLEAAAAQYGGSVYENHWTVQQDGMTVTATVEETFSPLLGQALVTVQGATGDTLVQLTVSWQEVAA